MKKKLILSMTLFAAMFLAACGPAEEPADSDGGSESSQVSSDSSSESSEPSTENSPSNEPSTENSPSNEPSTENSPSNEPSTENSPSNEPSDTPPEPPVTTCDYYVIGSFVDNPEEMWDVAGGQPMTKMEEMPENVTAQYTVKISFDAGDEWKCIAADGNADKNHFEEDGGAINSGDMIAIKEGEDHAPKAKVVTAGEYTIYLKLYADGGDSIYITPITIINEGEGGDEPVAADWYIIGSFNTWDKTKGLISMQEIDSTDCGYDKQYKVTQRFWGSDEDNTTNWKCYGHDADGNECWLDNFETDAGAFVKEQMRIDDYKNAVVKVTGIYDIYLKVNTADPKNNHSIYVSPKVEYFIIGEGSFVKEGQDPWTLAGGVPMARSELSDPDNSSFAFYEASVTFEKDDLWSCADQKAEIMNNFDQDPSYATAFSAGDMIKDEATGKARVVKAGTYEIFLRIDETVGISSHLIGVPPLIESGPEEELPTEWYIVGEGSFVKAGQADWSIAGGVKLEVNPGFVAHNEAYPNQKAEYYCLSMHFEKDDCWAIIDVDQTIAIEYYNSDAGSAFAAGDMTVGDLEESVKGVFVNRSGDYDIYLKFYDEGTHDTWVQRSSGSTENEGTVSTAAWYIVGDGSFVKEGEQAWTVAGGIEMTLNEGNPNKSLYTEYMLLNYKMVAEDDINNADVWKCCSGDGATWVTVFETTGENNAFTLNYMELITDDYGGKNAKVLVTGSYDFYLKIPVDGTSAPSIYVCPTPMPGA